MDKKCLTAFEGLKKLMQKTNYDGDNINIWEWWSGTALYGIIRCHEKYKESELLDFLEKWHSKNVGMRQTGSVNRVFCACVSEYLYEIYKKEEYKDVCEEYKDWCLHSAVKTDNGGFAHVWGPDKNGVEMGPPGLENQLWIDTTLMSCVFMLRYGKYSNDKKLSDAAKEQLRIHFECLFNKKDCLCYHGYDCGTGLNIGCYWGRGNGWIAAATAEMIRLGIRDEYVEDVFKKLMQRIYDLKSVNGFVHTLINDKSSYIESTGSALIAYAAAAAAKTGFLEEKYYGWAERIYDNISFNDKGYLDLASSGTEPNNAGVYKNIPFADLAYGNGLVMLLGSAIDG